MAACKPLLDVTRLRMTPCWPARTGRRSADGAQCWTAVSTEAFARDAIAEGLPLQVDGKYNPAGEADLATVTSGTYNLLSRNPSCAKSIKL